MKGFLKKRKPTLFCSRGRSKTMDLQARRQVSIQEKTVKLLILGSPTETRLGCLIR